MKRLLSVIHNPVYGGAHVQLIRLREPLAERGWETLALMPDEQSNGRTRLLDAGVDVISIPLRRLRATPRPDVQAGFLSSLPGEVKAIRRVLRERRIDLVQAHGPTNPHGPLAAHREGVAVVWQIYDTVAPMSLRRLTMPLVVRLADSITTWGDDLARTHPGTLGLGPRHVTVFPPVDGSEYETSRERREAARRELGIPADALAVGTVGNRNPSKGHQYLVRAAAVVRRQRGDVVFRVMGAHSPPHAAHEAKVDQEAEELGLGDPAVLRFLDPEGRVRELLPGLDVFAMTSVPRSEGMPTAILEAMACGLPVVATDVGAIGELVEDGVSGFITPPLDPDATAEALMRLLEDPDLRRSMGEAGRRLASERFGLDRLADLHAEAYEIAVEHRRGRAR